LICFIGFIRSYVISSGLTPNGGVAPLTQALTSLLMNIKGFVKLIQNNRISRQDAAPTVEIEMWDPAKREINWRDLLFLR